MSEDYWYANLFRDESGDWRMVATDALPSGTMIVGDFTEFERARQEVREVNWKAFCVMIVLLSPHVHRAHLPDCRGCGGGPRCSGGSLRGCPHGRGHGGRGEDLALSGLGGSEDQGEALAQLRRRLPRC
jgi:hypothetical protein